MSVLASLRSRLSNFSEVVALISFLLVFLFFATYADNFLSFVSLSNIITIASVKGIFVVGVAMLMISGEFDLSVGSTLAVAAYLFAVSLDGGMNVYTAIGLTLVVSALLGLVNGLIVVKAGIPSFIATLGTLLAYRGIARAIGDGAIADFTGETPAVFSLLNGGFDTLNQTYSPVGNARMVIVWFGLAVIIASIIMTRTRYGSWVYATGGNRAAALAQGVKTNQVVVINFIVTAFLAGLAGIIQFTSRPSVNPRHGEGWELIAVAACVIGGIWLAGGYGTIVGAALGILLLQMVEQGLILVGVDVQLFQAALGLILVLAVISNTYLSRQTG